MAERERAAQNKQTDVDQKHRVRQKESEPSFDQFHAWDTGPFSLTETPFSPQVDKHAESLAILLREHRANQELERTLLGRPLIPDDLVFCYPDGTPLPPNSVTKAFHRLAKSVGISGVRLHDLRHTHATLMLRQGVHPKVVSERLGHSSVAITLDTYSHVLPGIQAAAAKRFDEGLQSTTEETSAERVG